MSSCLTRAQECFFTPETETHYANFRPNTLFSFCVLTAGTYFLASVAGSMDIFPKDEPVPPAVYALSVLSGIVISMTVYEAFKAPLLKPSSEGYRKSISLFAKIAGGASLSFYTAGQYGASLMGLPNSVQITFAAGCLATRFYICHRSAYLLCNILPKVSEALKNGQASDIFAFLFCFLLGAAINLFQTDSNIAAIQNISSNQLTGKYLPIAYTLMSLFCLSAVPGSSIFAYFGWKRLTDAPKEKTFSGKLLEKLPLIFAALFCIGIFTLPALGALTNAESEDGLTSWVASPSDIAKAKLPITILFTLLSTLSGGEKFLRKTYAAGKSALTLLSRNNQPELPLKAVTENEQIEREFTDSGIAIK
jgi:hypothetical protein